MPRRHEFETWLGAEFPAVSDFLDHYYILLALITGFVVGLLVNDWKRKAAENERRKRMKKNEDVEYQLDVCKTFLFVMIDLLMFCSFLLLVELWGAKAVIIFLSGYIHFNDLNAAMNKRAAAAAAAQKAKKKQKQQLTDVVVVKK